VKYKIIIASAVIAGCGSNTKSKKGKESDNNEKPVFDSFGLMGAWKRSCLDFEFSSKQKSRQFSATSDIEIQTMYANKGCSAGDEAIVYKITYANARAINPTDLEGYTKIRSETVTSTATVYISYIADEFNRSAVYDYSDWKPNVERDISGRKFKDTSMAESSNGSLVYMHFLKEGDYLSFATYKDQTALKETDNSNRYIRFK
jgi:hypothetical protein